MIFFVMYDASVNLYRFYLSSIGNNNKYSLQSTIIRKFPTYWNLCSECLQSIRLLYRRYALGLMMISKSTGQDYQEPLIAFSTKINDEVEVQNHVRKIVFNFECISGCIS